MKRSINVTWGESPVKLTWIPNEYPNDTKKVTSTHGICFEHDKILLVNIKDRGFNFPGGHIEKGETPEDAFHREVYEEGYVRGDIKYLGMIEVSHENNPLFDPKGKYPMIGYQLFYRMDVSERLSFERKHESLTRIWVEPTEVQYIINDHEIAIVALDEAIQKGKVE
jgi:8-oxo-dGTP diphosphatase